MEKNLQKEEAIKKFRDLAKEINVCMFITKPEEEQSSRPMATIKADEDGTLWFYTKDSSGKTKEIKEESEVHLVYAHPGKESYMDVWGSGKIVRNRKKIEELWNPIIKAWFPDGVDDPDLCLLSVSPQSVYYWDSEAGKMVSFFKVVASAVTGKKLQEGVEGNLNVK